jgi:hypothetical protein
VNERLWVCDACELIGSEVEAIQHQREHGHTPHQLSAEMSDAVRVEQAKRPAWPTAADWIAFAEFKKRVLAATTTEEGGS